MSELAAIWPAIKTRLIAAGLKAYDEVPASPPAEYVNLQTVQIIPDETHCSFGSEVFVTLDGWSKNGTGAARLTDVGALAGAVRTAVRDLAVPGFDVVVQDGLETRLLKDPAQGVSHAVMTLRLEVEPV